VLVLLLLHGIDEMAKRSLGIRRGGKDSFIGLRAIKGRPYLAEGLLLDLYNDHSVKE
jgi:hypothetical protein